MAPNGHHLWATVPGISHAIMTGTGPRYWPKSLLFRDLCSESGGLAGEPGFSGAMQTPIQASRDEALLGERDRGHHLCALGAGISQVRPYLLGAGGLRALRHGSFRSACSISRLRGRASTAAFSNFQIAPWATILRLRSAISGHKNFPLDPELVCRNIAAINRTRSRVASPSAYPSATS